MGKSLLTSISLKLGTNLICLLTSYADDDTVVFRTGASEEEGTSDNRKSFNLSCISNFFSLSCNSLSLTPASLSLDLSGTLTSLGSTRYCQRYLHCCWRLTPPRVGSLELPYCSFLHTTRYCEFIMLCYLS